MRRSVVLFVGGAMAALMLATAGIASAVGPGKPTVVSTSPADEATGVDRDANITAKFSEKMMRSTIAARIVYPEKAGGTAIPAEVKYNSRKKAILDPLVSLEALTQYTATWKVLGIAMGWP